MIVRLCSGELEGDKINGKIRLLTVREFNEGGKQQDLIITVIIVIILRIITIINRLLPPFPPIPHSLLYICLVDYHIYQNATDTALEFTRLTNMQKMVHGLAYAFCIYCQTQPTLSRTVGTN